MAGREKELAKLLTLKEAFPPKYAPSQGRLDAAALGTAAIPGIGDLAGLLADASSMRKDPSWGNALSMMLGAIPLVPGGSAKRVYESIPIKPKYKVDPIGGYKTIKAEETLKSLPPVEEGKIRLFRARGGKYEHDDVWREGTIPESNPEHLPGRFFTPDIKYADYYRETYGPGSELVYVDVPIKELDKWKSPKFDGEYIVP